MLNFFKKEQITLDKNQFSILRLIRSDNIGTKTFYNLIKYYGSAETTIENLPEFIKRSGSTKTKIAPTQTIDKEIDLMEKTNAKFLFYTDSDYPDLLKSIDDSPPVISYKGQLTNLKKPSIAIVGARNCSLAGKNFASKISKELSANSIAIVSGLARGIDTEAHLASFPNTIAVIAGGIDNIYPPENKKLYEALSENSLIFAELPVGSEPLARHFPQRNRIISGLSLGTVVIEASLQSGSLITANFALEQNREVFVCPGHPLDPRCKGSNKLIKQGAVLLEESSDILDFISDFSSKLMDKNEKIKPMPLHKIVEENLLNNSSRQAIIDCLSSYPCKIEEISEFTNLPIAIVTTILLELELQGKIVYQPGNRYSLNYANI